MLSFFNSCRSLKAFLALFYRLSRHGIYRLYAITKTQGETTLIYSFRAFGFFSVLYLAKEIYRERVRGKYLGDYCAIKSFTFILMTAKLCNRDDLLGLYTFIFAQ